MSSLCGLKRRYSSNQKGNVSGAIFSKLEEFRFSSAIQVPFLIEISSSRRTFSVPSEHAPLEFQNRRGRNNVQQISN